MGFVRGTLRKEDRGPTLHPHAGKILSRVTSHCRFLVGIVVQPMVLMLAILAQTILKLPYRKFLKKLNRANEQYDQILLALNMHGVI